MRTRDGDDRGEGWVEQFRDPEVEQLGLAFWSDDDVLGFQVSVYNQIRVRVVDRFAHLCEYLEPFSEREIVRVAVGRDRLAFDVLHDEVGAPVVGFARLDEAGDVWVIEGAEDLAFDGEAFEDIRGVGSLADEFDGDEACPGAASPAGLEDHAHPASSDLSVHAIDTDLLGHRVVILLAERHDPAGVVRGPVPDDGLGRVLIRDRSFLLVHRGVPSKEGA